MGNRGSYEFSQKTKDEIYRRDKHKYPDNDDLEFDHILSVRQAKELGIPAWIVSSAINGQLLTRQENREKSDKDADPVFVDYLLSLIVRMI